MLNTMSHNTASHELSIEDLASVAGGEMTVKGFVDSVLIGAAATGVASLVAGPEAVPAGLVGGAVGGAVTYLFNHLTA